MKTVNISFSSNTDILKNIWIDKRTKALKIIQECSEKYTDDLSQVALGYLMELLKLDGDNEYILNEERKVFCYENNSTTK